MSPDKHPRWVRDLAGEIHALIQRFDAMERFRQMLQDWVDGFQESSPCVQNPAVPLLPIPDRKLTLAERYTILAAIHDEGWRGEKIDPWRDANAVMEWPPYGVLRLYVSETLETDVPYIREMLADVERDLREKGEAEQDAREGNNAQTKYASEADPIPETYHTGEGASRRPCGPIEGNQTELAWAIDPRPGREPRDRQLKALHGNRVWVVAVSGKRYSVYFRSMREKNNAQHRLDEYRDDPECWKPARSE